MCFVSLRLLAVRSQHLYAATTIPLFEAFPPLSTALALLPARVFSTLCPVLKDWVQQFWFAGYGCPAFSTGLEPPALCLYSAQAWRRAGRRSLRPS